VGVVEGGRGLGDVVTVEVNVVVGAGLAIGVGWYVAVTAGAAVETEQPATTKAPINNRNITRRNL
jgi:hypothetical protein